MVFGATEGVGHGMEFVRIKKPGLLTTVQDLGRPNYRKYGVSVSGVMDQYSFRIANLLVGNKENEAGLEVTLIGPTLEFTEDVFFTITGANLTPSLNNVEIPMWSVVRAKEGDILRFGQCVYGCRAYIAFSGGIDVPEVMDSKSTFLIGNYGGFKGRALAKDDVLTLKDPVYNIPYRRLRSIDIPDFAVKRKVRFIGGPHENEFESHSVDTFLTTAYTLSNSSDRMGYRLEGEVLQHKRQADIFSDFIAVGTIQVPGSGLPIIHMADCGTSGGYTKMGVVISCDIPYVAQLKPGDQINFEKVSVEKALDEMYKMEEFIKQIKLNNRLFIN